MFVLPSAGHGAPPEVDVFSASLARPLADRHLPTLPARQPVGPSRIH
jgi:hypothetical protein